MGKKDTKVRSTLTTFRLAFCKRFHIKEFMAKAFDTLDVQEQKNSEDVYGYWIRIVT